MLTGRSAVYLDGSSGEPVLPEARAVWNAAWEAGWGDPAALHYAGRSAARAMDQARTLVAEGVGARADEVVFTGSGVLANQAAVAGLALGRQRVGRAGVSSAIDHTSVLRAMAVHTEHHLVGVDRLGCLDLDDWRAAVARPGVALATLQVANHEVGTLQPYVEAAELSRTAGVPLVLDASAALGRIDLRNSGQWSVLTASAQAFGGPPSIGVLVIRKGVRWRAPYPIDDYQAGRWPGPPDVPNVFAAAVALDTWLGDTETSQRQRALIDRLRTGVTATVTDVDVVGDPTNRVPHLLTFSALYVDGETLTLELDKAGFAVASGSACSSLSETPSHVLAAMGALTHGNLRIGLTRTTTEAQIDAFLAALGPVVSEIRARLGAP